MFQREAPLQEKAESAFPEETFQDILLIFLLISFKIFLLVFLSIFILISLDFSLKVSAGGSVARRCGKCIFHGNISRYCILLHSSPTFFPCVRELRDPELDVLRKGDFQLRGKAALPRCFFLPRILPTFSW